MSWSTTWLSFLNKNPAGLKFNQPDDTSFSWYPITQVPKYPSAIVPKCPSPKFPSTKVRKWHSAQVPKYPSDQIPSAQVFMCPSTQVPSVQVPKRKIVRGKKILISFSKSLQTLINVIESAHIRGKRLNIPGLWRFCFTKQTIFSRRERFVFKISVVPKNKQKQTKLL